MPCLSSTGEDDSPTYGCIKSLAYGYAILWPVGVPVLLAAFLGCCRRDLIAGKRTPLT